MYKFVDDTEDDVIFEGFAYKNLDGKTECVDTTESFGNYPTVQLRDDNDEEYVVYVDDIPKLIKALQAAYDHVQKENK